MIIRAVKTRKIEPSACTIFEILDESLENLQDGSVVAITSKIISLCEGSIVPMKGTDKEELVKEESGYYLPAEYSKYGYHFTLVQNTLISVAGIDESNGDGNYILWPKEPQKTTNEIRNYLKTRFGHKNTGVVIVDSTVMPLRWGTVGIALAYSGFKPTNNYIGKPDLFGRSFEVSRSGIASGLAASAVLAMGEGTEQTPLALIEDIPFVQFQDHDPTSEELEGFYISNKDDDLFAPFLNAVNWLPGKKGQAKTT